MNSLKQPLHLISISTLPFEDEVGGGEFFLKYLKAPVGEGGEWGLLVFTGENVDDNFGSFKLNGADSGEDLQGGVCFVFDDEGVSDAKLNLDDKLCTLPEQ